MTKLPQKETERWRYDLFFVTICLICLLFFSSACNPPWSLYVLGTLTSSWDSALWYLRLKAADRRFRGSIYFMIHVFHWIEATGEFHKHKGKNTQASSWEIHTYWKRRGKGANLWGSKKVTRFISPEHKENKQEFHSGQLENKLVKHEQGAMVIGRATNVTNVTQSADGFIREDVSLCTGCWNDRNTVIFQLFYKVTISGLQITVLWTLFFSSLAGSIHTL